jgi:hypothetical protein
LRGSSSYQHFTFRGLRALLIGRGGEHHVRGKGKMNGGWRGEENRHLRRKEEKSHACFLRFTAFGGLSKPSVLYKVPFWVFLIAGDGVVGST